MRKEVVALSLLAVSTKTKAHREGVAEAVRTIKASLERAATDVVEDGPETVCGVEECRLSEMGSVGRVYPGGETTCIFGAPFAFDVYKGSRSEVFFYFEGGGACWDYATTFLDPLCTTSVGKPVKVGIFDKTHPRNPFRDTTIVNVRYCSGDSHVGNATSRGLLRTATQVGIANARSALEWVRRQQALGELETELDLLVVGGASAGSIGAQIWAQNVSRALPSKSTALLFDSYVGVLNFESQLFQGLGTCSFLPTQDLRERCFRGDLTLDDVTAAQLSALPDAAVASILSKEDAVQISYYDALQVFRPRPEAAEETGAPLFISPAAFYDDAQRILQRYTYGAPDRPAGDAVAFVVDGDKHTYLPETYLYDTVVLDGPRLLNNEDSSGNSTRAVPLTQWIADLVSTDHSEEVPSSCEVCAGPRIPLPAPGHATSTTYCDVDLDHRCATLPPSSSEGGAVVLL